jgi:hypothetical protein
MSCLTCANWDAKRTRPEVRKLRLAVCAVGPMWEYLPPHATCKRFTPATPEIQSARLKWKERHETPPSP